MVDNSQRTKQDMVPFATFFWLSTINSMGLYTIKEHSISFEEHWWMYVSVTCNIILIVLHRINMDGFIRLLMKLKASLNKCFQDCHYSTILLMFS
jgi:hypothetical protein